MKFISISIIFTAIIAMGVFFLEPLTRDYHEEILKRKALNALYSAEYRYSEVEVDHLHATRIVVYKDTTHELSEAKIKAHVASTVRNVPGVYAGEDVVEVRPELDKFQEEVKRRSSEVNASKDAPEIADQSLSSSSKSQDSREGEVGKMLGAGASISELSPSSHPQPTELKMVKKESEKRASSLVLSWSPHKKNIVIAGELSSEKDKEFISKIIRRKYAKSAILNNAKVLSDDVKKLQNLQDVIPHLPSVIKYSYGKGTLVAIDDPARLEVNGEVFNRSLHQQVSKKLNAISGGKLTLVNNLKYAASFNVVKDPIKKSLILEGVSNSYNSSLLVSRVRAVAGSLDGYSTNVDGLKVDKRCLDFEWGNGEQAMMANHLVNAESGELVYRGGKPTEITLVTSNKRYQAALMTALKDVKEIKSDITYIPVEKPAKPSSEELAHLDAKAAKEALVNEMKDFRVYFKSGSDYVGAENNEKLKQVAEFIKNSKDKTTTLIIGGYADQSGKAASNKRLSLKRARAVQIKLVALGVPASRLETSFFGAEVSDNKKESRRVEIQIK